MITLFLNNYIRDKSVVFWIVVFPTLFYFTFSTIFYKLGEDFVPEVEAKIPKILYNVLKDHFDIVQVQDEKKIINDVNKGVVDCGVILKDGKFIVYYTSRTTSTIAKGMLEGFFTAFGYGGKDIKVIIEENYEEKINSYEYYFPAGVLMAILGVGFFGAIYSETEIREKGLHKIFKVLPQKRFPLDLIMFISHFLAILISLCVLLIVSIVVGVNVNYANLMFSVLFGAAVFITLGMGIGKVSGKKSELVANLLYFPMLFLSGAFFEVSIKYSPATTLVNILKRKVSFMQVVLWIMVSFVIYIMGSVWYAKAD